ncbi:tRNA 2-selenouridine(34) synthase MnmH [Geobacter sp. FeAm09]|uniref:tRNA 2-selenouridine(34) synthase MnmH n=1 Tax=Geobacter sp. FeAm09 TaxID=2597769 RepID=UPI0011F0478E|nr:tRNA 2-selenouridine(34) synthase MnmH [Geobacter sp. FeAm09]QEM67066.1 tRNA 2-selenouridine(34) synthase MnmH [Geobacter sp. FeAm09]
MPHVISFTPALLDTHCIVDVRTPLEFAEDHLPGAVNVPILTNEERAEIGTLHKEAGPRQARMRGLELTCGRFAAMVHEVVAHAAGRQVLVYCWRGGLRSLSMAILLEMSGYPVAQLKGGYRAFRNQVVSYFENFAPPGPLLVIHGMTGTGKTTFINGLDRDRWTVIDLEGLACHRGSAFGEVGLVQAISQKHFDTILWDAFRNAPEGRPIVVEGESQRIGRISLPGSVYETMGKGCKIWCHASLETRVQRLSAEYACVEYRESMAVALERIRKKLGGVRYTEITALLERWDVGGVARGLIEHYYDRLYYKNRPWTPDAEIDLEDFSLAGEHLAEFWSERQRRP